MHLEVSSPPPYYNDSKADTAVQNSLQILEFNHLNSGIEKWIKFISVTASKST
jgi:hypothetical protein